MSSEIKLKKNLILDLIASTLYGDGRIRSPNTTCPKFSTGDCSSSPKQKSKLD